MTEPTIMKAMEYLDDDLIAAAAERKAAPRLLTRRKVVALLAACLLLVCTFAIMGMEEKPAEPTQEEIQAALAVARRDAFDQRIETYKNDPEVVEYCMKWRDIDIPDPYPAEWFNEDGTLKEFVTEAMLYEALENSLLYESWEEDPLLNRGREPFNTIIVIQDNEIVGYMNEVLGDVYYHTNP